ncbi:hypothetical protein G647_00879 [Cladophialophora carrionii CBS 160.54]|uniref:AAA+ ATPase domain-containing protein n=1 Tax=Cladophialophora carrionii CBS 160.54 TaxID=1279043 RepID=V9DNH8_9EURO|nr:uncharacterized protein G647_00879 [Cladophialophora carrionii CBS 160.54]ETI28430.1 hypothetical protein G647_00879 [Cladophialophora carrionii CBS 160.54]
MDTHANGTTDGISTREPDPSKSGATGPPAPPELVSAENTEPEPRPIDEHREIFDSGYDEIPSYTRRRRSRPPLIDDSDSSDSDFQGNIRHVASQYVREAIKYEEESRLVEEWSPDLETTKTDQAATRRNIPQVLWRVDVYRKGLGDRERPTVTFRNDCPYDLSLCQQLPTPTARPSEAPDTERAAKDVPAPRPDQPVFELETRVLEQTKAKGSKYQYGADIRESFDQLQIEKFAKTRMIIHSKALSDALASLVSYYPALPRPETPSLIPEPYDLLMHHFAAIEDFVEGEDPRGMPKEAQDLNAAIDLERSKIAVEHMKLLYHFLKPQYENRIQPCLDGLSQAIPQISFDMLWYLFRPGVDVYVQSDDMISVCVVREVKSNLDQTKWLSSTTPSYWEVDAWHLVTNGARIARTKVMHQINSYTGLRDVTSLPLCPVSYWDATDGGARREQILRRSGMYVSALKAGNMLASYDGPDLVTTRHYKGKVVVDVRRALTYDTDRTFTSPDLANVVDDYPQFAEYDYIYVNESEYAGDREQDRAALRRKLSGVKLAVSVEEIERDSYPVERSPDGNLDSAASIRTTELTEHQLLLLYPSTFAFGISSKQWMAVRVDRMQTISSSSESIENLIIDKDELNTIRALSNQQSSKIDSWSADFIAGKGSGQIILLHGPPGVGKTYTVESIAEWLHRPLLALTVADIGTRETKIEAELLKWFDLAEAWNAVLLVDEADIFLEQRKNRDLARNGLVSAFLRRMEYFNGLLFLTTNRVGQIDDAFISRVHVAISYPTLTADIRRKIWNGFFKKLVKERVGKIKVALNAKKWVLDNVESQDEMNGRDIRNALQTAIRLAEFEAIQDPDNDPNESIVVEEAHFRRVLDMSNKFHKYVNSIRREDEAKRAGLRGDRNDYAKDEEEGAEWPKAKNVRFV